MMKLKTVIEGKRFGEERALYHTENAIIRACRFEGEEDGESALKECRDTAVEECYFDLRYPFWHGEGLALDRCELTERCRAPLWYDSGAVIRECRIDGVKALRECKDARIYASDMRSAEFGWKCDTVLISGGSLTSEYAFFDSRRITVSDLEFSGKYSFQYTEDVEIKNSRLLTKDAFWHAKNVTVADSLISGEYLGWYSENLTLIRCHITGTQPLCYCKGLRLIDCTTEGCDLAFEYSDVEASISGGIDSVKNPRSGSIRADSIGEIIREKDAVHLSRARIFEGGAER